MAIDRGPVLVVDDDDGCRDLISTTLTRGGYHIRSAGDGDEALAAAREEPPSLVVLDVHLPGRSGYDVCRELRAEFGDRLPLLFISGERTEPYDRVAGLRLGADDYIVKPFDPDELLARVDRFVGRSEADRAAEPVASYALTRRELEVLRLLGFGYSPKEIGRELSVSRKTISTHIQNVLSKLDVHSQAQAVALAFRSGLIDSSETHVAPGSPSWSVAKLR